MRRQSRKGGGRQVDVTIEALGAQGDGIAFYGNRPVFVPLTLPGERVRLRLQAQKGGTFRASPLELLQEGKGRAEAPCPHFGSCGACQLQHLEPDYYRSWKEALIPDALQRQGIEAERLHAPIYIAPGTRRRAALAFRQQGRRLELGFHKSTSRSIVDLKVCLLLTPALFALLQPLRRALEAAGSFRGRGDVLLLQADNGVDLLLITPDPPELAAREHLIRFATEQDIARIAWASDQRMAPELLFQKEAPRLAFGGIPVTPPPGGFVQPSREGEETLVSAIRRAIPGGTRRVIELFAGCGSFTFPLAEGAFVTAVEGDAAALEALWSAARRSGLAGPVMIEQRDLVRQPLLPEELAIADAVVFDPPRQGAKEQAQEIAMSPVPRVVAVSCSPASFARDARLLVEGGYRLEWVQPVDQFPWAAHLELVACFSR